MSKLLSLLKGAQIPGPGNRLWNWASKISEAVDNGGGGGSGGGYLMAMGTTNGYWGLANAVNPPVITTYGYNCIITPFVDGKTDGEWIIQVTNPAVNFGYVYNEPPANKTYYASLVNPTAAPMISVDTGLWSLQDFGTDGVIGNYDGPINTLLIKLFKPNGTDPLIEEFFGFTFQAFGPPLTPNPTPPAIT